MRDGDTVERMARVPYAKGIAKRGEILDVAFDLFSRQGYDRTSVREIARAVGLSQAGLIHHFSSKEELFVEVLRRRSEENIRDFAVSDPVDTLVAIQRHNRDVPGLVRLYATLSAESTDTSHPAHDFFGERYAKIRAELAEGVRAAQDAGEIDAELDPEAIARILLAAADGLQVQWLHDPTTDMAEEIRLLWRVIRRSGPQPAQ